MAKPAPTKPRPPGPLDRELVDAAFVCDLLRVRDLLARGANPDAPDDDGRPPLVSAVLGGSVALVGLLLEHKADVNAADPHGWTALHFAAQDFLPQMASLLLAKGADANAKDDEGNTPLWRAVFFARGRDELVRLLRKHGARDDVANRAGETPRKLADRLGDPVFTDN
jgi:ankyrin repeat protein